MQRARTVLHSWREDKSLIVAATEHSPNTCIDSWRKPHVGWLKVNVDAAVVGDGGGCSVVLFAEIRSCGGPATSGVIWHL